MTDAIGRLVRHGTGPLSEVTATCAIINNSFSSHVTKELSGLLNNKNGFMAFESALHVLCVDAESDLGLQKWNDMLGWRSCYGVLAGRGVFFAQDLFGGQFAILDDGIYRFDLEVAEYRRVADSISEWAELIVDDCDYQTGWSLAKEWVSRNGPIPYGSRLYPKVPFTLGGDFDIINLWCTTVDRVSGFFGFLASKLHGLPDGTPIQLKAADGRVLERTLKR